MWVPTPQALVDKMLDMAKVTPSDFVMDWGQGRTTVITAAKEAQRRWASSTTRTGRAVKRNAQKGAWPPRQRSYRATSSKPSQQGT